MKFMIAFVAMVVLDFVWVIYTRSIVEKHPFRASCTAALMQLLTAVVVLAYVAEPTAVAGAMLGAFSGTWIAMKVLK